MEFIPYDLQAPLFSFFKLNGTLNELIESNSLLWNDIRLAYETNGKELNKRIMKDAFSTLLMEDGSLEKLEWLYLCDVISILEIDTLDKNVPEGYSLEQDYHRIQINFRQLCLNDNLEKAKWLYSLDIVDLEYSLIYDIFEKLCDKNCLKTLKWLYPILSDYHEDYWGIHNLENIFNNCCIHGYFELAQYLNKTFRISETDIIIPKGTIESIIEDSYFELVKWLVDEFHIDLSNDKYLMIFAIHTTRSNKNIEVKFNILKWLYEEILDDFDTEISVGNMSSYETMNDQQIINDLFDEVCAYNMLEIAQWIYSLGLVNFEKLFEDNCWCFTMLCYKANLETIKWFYSVGNINIYDNYHRSAFVYTCCHCRRLDNYDIIEWLISIGYTNMIIEGECLQEWKQHYFNDYCCGNDSEHIFHLMCMSSNLEKVQWMYDRIDKNDIDLEHSFELTCAVHHWDMSMSNDDEQFVNKDTPIRYEVALWLYSLLEQTDYIISYETVVKTFESGNFMIAEWINQIKNYNLDLERIYTEKCRKGHLNDMKRIYSSNNIDVHNNNDIPLREACLNNSTNCAKWLYSLELDEPFDITLDDHYIFKQSCLKGWDNYYITNWLCEICKFYDIDEKLDTDIITPIIKSRICQYIENKEYEKAITEANFIITEDIEEYKCSICWGENNLVTNCNHLYCTRCLFDWYLNNSKCPYCLQKIILEKCKFNGQLLEG